MDFCQSQNHKQAPKRLKKRLTEDQVRLLESNFNHDMKLEPDRKNRLASELGLHPRQVAIWYQNKRARWKNQTLELDYKTLQIRLNGVLAEKKKLDREVGRLRDELMKAQEMLVRINPIHVPPSITVYGDKDEGSSMQVEANRTWGNVGQLHVDELYACLIAAEVKLQN